MAIAIVADSDGMTAEHFAVVQRAAWPDGAIPPGLVIHVAGPTGTGWRVIEIWEARDPFEHWLEMTYLPVLWRLGAAQPQIEVTEIGRLLGPFPP